MSAGEPAAEHRRRLSDLGPLSAAESYGALESPTWRGWLVSLLSCAALGLLIPPIDMLIRSTRLTFNLLPASSLVIVFGLILVFNAGLFRFHTRLRLVRADLILVFCTTMLVNSLPGCGLLNWVVNTQLGLSYHATGENNFREVLFPIMPLELTPRDPAQVDRVRVAATEHVAAESGEEGGLRNAPRELDGLTLKAGDRLLLTAQRDSRENGLYRIADAALGRWARADDAKWKSECHAPWYAEVAEGGRAGRFFLMEAALPARIGEAPLSFRELANDGELLRPAEWFYGGMPRKQQSGLAVWAALYRSLAPSFLRWCVGAGLAFMVFFGLAMLLRRQWDDRERLPFPLAQPLETMLEEGHGENRGFLSDRLAWAGIGLVFLLHSWNAFETYSDGWPTIPLKNDLRAYLTEPPWSYLRPLHCHIFPSVVAFMFLVSREVSFSLWFFYLVVMKIGVMIASGSFGLGQDGWYFTGGDGPKTIFVSQGTGAMLILVLAGAYFARRTLWSSLRQGLGLAPREADEPCSPLWGWGLFLGGMGALVVWLCLYGMKPGWAAVLVACIVVSSVGVARLVSESGMLFTRGPNAAALTNTFFTPVQVGAKDSVLLGTYGKVFEFETFRMIPLTYLVSALHIGKVGRVNLNRLLLGMAVAIPLTLATAFFSYYYVGCSSPIGAKQMGWTFSYWAEGNYRDKTDQARRIKKAEQALEARTQEAKSRAAAAREANLDGWRVGWTAVGAAVMTGFLLLRSHVFWWPHPIGYVMWMAQHPMYQMWFSYLLGWLLKTLILRVGGNKAFSRGRRFFVGVIVGEALATLFWIAVAAWMGKSDGYAIEYN